MYKLSRLMLILTVALFAYSFVLAVILTAPVSLFCVVALAVAVAAKKRHAVLTAFGTARWAGEDDLRRARMLDAKEGLILGRFDGKPRLLNGLKALFNCKLRSKDACRQFLVPLSSRRIKAEASLVRLPQACHTAVFAPTGVGKGVSCVIPFLLTCEDSCVVVDFKGELASITAEHRRRMGHEIVILDPYKVVTS